MAAAWSYFFGAQKPPPEPPKIKGAPRTKGAVFRVTGIPLETTVDELHSALLSEFSSDEIKVDPSQTAMCPSSYDKRTQTALVEFTPYAPDSLVRLPHNDTYEIRLGNTGHDISIDKDFYGLTQLYPTKGEINVDIVAVCGLNGHAYGSWTAKSNGQGQRKMWLRHFFLEDFPHSRTMIYGYNSKLTSNSIHTIPDFTDTFLEELTKARQSEKEMNRPIIFIGHSFGGIIIAQSIFKAKLNRVIHGPLSQKNCITIFFGTPHRGLVVDDILAMLGENSPREDLVNSIKKGSDALKDELERFINCCTVNNLKIVSFKETQRTRKLKQGPNGTWSRSGDFFTAVDSKSSVLQLPDTIEESFAVEGDHSTMVKFKHKGHQSYTSVIKHLGNFTPESESEKHLMAAYNAVINKNAADLERILRNSAVDVNKSLSPKGNKTTLLQEAIDKNSEDTISVLLTYGSDIEAVNEKGNTALHSVAFGGWENVVKLLLRKGADIAAVNKNGDTALHLAAFMGHLKAVKVLLENQADIAAANKDSETALHKAAYGGHESVVKVLLENQADIAAVDKDGDTALHLAAYKGHESVVKVLLENQADIVAVNKDVMTALHKAAYWGHESVVKVLLENQVDIAAVDKDGDTALHLAAYKGHESVVKVLLENQADIAVVNKDGSTALHYAAYGGHEEVVKVLLENQADIAAASKNGDTTLHRAAFMGYENVVKVLLENQADIAAVNKNGDTALQYAAYWGHENVVKVLLESQADIAAVSENGDTALHRAAFMGYENVVKVLLENQADIAAINKGGKTALDLATQAGHEMVKALLKN